MTERIVDALARKAERERLAAELKGKAWTRSEVNALTAELAGDAAGLKELHAVISEAERAGRVTDDTGGSPADVASMIPADSWRMSIAELTCFNKWAAGTGNPAFREAAKAVSNELAATGRVSTDADFGEVYRSAVPEWANPLRAVHKGNPQTPAERHAYDAQVARFQAMEAGWQAMVERRINGEPPQPWQPGFSWQSIPADNAPLAHIQTTRAAQQAANEHLAAKAKAAVDTGTQTARATLSGPERVALEATEAQAARTRETRAMMGLVD